MALVFRLGSLTIALEGRHPVIDHLRTELSSLLADKGEPDVTVVVHDGDIPQWRESGYHRLGPVRVCENHACVHFERVGFTLGIPGASQPREYHLGIRRRPMPGRLPRWAFRWLDPTNLRPAESQAYWLIHMLLEGLLLMEGGDSEPLHASAIALEGSTIVLPSTGGIGKTTTALELVRRPGRTFLADDIAILVGGQIVPYSRRAMIYKYNVDGQPGLRQKVVQPLPMASRVHWHVWRRLRPQAVRRRVELAGLSHASDVRMGRPAPIGVVAFLYRTDSTRLAIREVEAQEMAERCAAVAALEFGQLLDSLRVAEAGGFRPGYVEALLSGLVVRYRNSFASAARLIELGIPETAPAVVVADAVEHLAIEASGQ